MNFSQALESARAAVASGDLLDYFVEREGGGTNGARYIVGRSDQGDFIWWEPEPVESFDW